MNGHRIPSRDAEKGAFTASCNRLSRNSKSQRKFKIPAIMLKNPLIPSLMAKPRIPPALSKVSPFHLLECFWPARSTLGVVGSLPLSVAEQSAGGEEFPDADFGGGLRQAGEADDLAEGEGLLRVQQFQNPAGTGSPFGSILLQIALFDCKYLKWVQRAAAVLPTLHSSAPATGSRITLIVPMPSWSSSMGRLPCPSKANGGYAGPAGVPTK